STAETTLLPALDSFEDSIAQPIEDVALPVLKNGQCRMPKRPLTKAMRLDNRCTLLRDMH
ncbi:MULTISPECIES: hypothetical protein, partial [unclassified Sinorhizobium]|uniref:hypothetical protein n=1 Tax=unclassified Sinorhizobium TaxID=2613772 RepID=UPI0035256D52